MTQGANRSARLVQRPSHRRRKPCAEFCFGYWESRSRSSFCSTSSTSFKRLPPGRSDRSDTGDPAARRPVRSPQSRAVAGRRRSNLTKRMRPRRRTEMPGARPFRHGTIRIDGEPVGIRTRDLLIKSSRRVAFGRLIYKTWLTLNQQNKPKNKALTH